MLSLTYFIKVILCSAILFGYYLIALRGKKIHQYNRFYLLFATAISWLIPLMKFEIAANQKISQPVYQAFAFIAESNTKFEEEQVQNITSSVNFKQLLPDLYFAIAGFILIALVFSLLKIYHIYKKYPNQKSGDYVLVNTTENGTPFSFFKFVFWNVEIDLNSVSGNHILQHELTHVRENHSWDKLFIQINLVTGWFNPFFWLIKKELEMIHEFIADNKAIADSNAADFASMLLVTAFPASKHKLINPFYYSPIKRRLNMITQNKKTGFSLLKKLIVLPLFAIVIFLFAFKQRENPASNAALSKKYKIVVDAGHGGTDFGCKSIKADVYEKDVNLAIVKSIKQLNTNDNIEIILTRDLDRLDDIKAKAEFINNQKADLCISIHCSDAGEDVQESGTEIYAANQKENIVLTNESNSLAQSVNGSLKNNFKSGGIKTNKNGIYILQASQCPAILIEVGYLSNREDASMLMKSEKQELIADNILKGIENYLALKEKR